MCMPHSKELSTLSGLSRAQLPYSTFCTIKPTSLNNICGPFLSAVHNYFDDQKREVVWTNSTMDVVKAFKGSLDTEGSSKYDREVKSHSFSEDDSVTDQSSISESLISEVDSDSDISESTAEEYDEDSDILSSDEEEDDDEDDDKEPSPSLLSRIFVPHDTCTCIGDNACGTMFDGNKQRSENGSLLQESNGTPYSTALYRNRRKAKKQSERYLKRFSKRMREKEDAANAEVAKCETKDTKSAILEREAILSPASSTMTTPRSLKQRLQNLVGDRRNNRNEPKDKRKSRYGRDKRVAKKSTSERTSVPVTTAPSTQSMPAKLEDSIPRTKVAKVKPTLTASPAAKASRPSKKVSSSKPTEKPKSASKAKVVEKAKESQPSAATQPSSSVPAKASPKPIPSSKPKKPVSDTSQSLVVTSEPKQAVTPKRATAETPTTAQSSTLVAPTLTQQAAEGA